MRAVVHDWYGPPNVLRLTDVERPVPRDNDVCANVYATAVNRTDCAIRSGDGLITRVGYSYVTTGSPFKALQRPQQEILGAELAGEVAASGAAVAEFEVGDRVFGLNAGHFGAHAEFICLKRVSSVSPERLGVDARA